MNKLPESNHSARLAHCRARSSCPSAAKLLARTADSVLERLFVRAERAFRQVEGLDQTRAGQIDLVAKDCALLRGEHTIVGADGMLKVDGEQVHIG